MRISGWSSYVCAADADSESVVDHQLFHAPVKASAARIGVDETVADLDRLRRHVGAQPGGHADAPVAVEDRIGPTHIAADQRVETLVEMPGHGAQRIARPNGSTRSEEPRE